MTDSELRELDAWIAEHVMGWTLTNYNDGRKASSTSDYADALNNDGWTWSNGTDEEAWQFQPSKKPAYAMDVLEKCAKAGIVNGEFTLPVSIRQRGDNQWVVSQDCSDVMPEDEFTSIVVEASTLPLAICLFAKKLFA